MKEMKRDPGYRRWMIGPFRGIVVLVVVFMAIGCAEPPAGEVPRLHLAASIYTGWMPWFLAAEDGTLQRFAEQNGVEIDFVRGDYIETINQFAAGGVDAVVLTNIDAMALLVGSDVKTDVILIGSYSHGNDAIFLRPDDASQSLAGKTLGMVEYSVSHYLLDRYLERQGTSYEQVEWLNISDVEIAPAFAAGNTALAGVVTWNPIALQIQQQVGGTRLFDSRSIPKEIADILVVRREVLDAHAGFAEALLATWFDVTSRMRGESRDQTLETLGWLSGSNGEQYAQQLAETLLLDSPTAALAALRDPAMAETMKEVRAFVNRHGLVPSAPPEPWVSYPGQERGIIHFNDELLSRFDASRGSD